MGYLSRLLWSLDRHSGSIAAVGLVVAGIGLLLTLRYLKLYEKELENQMVEQERLAWERILKLLNQVAKYCALAQVSSVFHSPIAKAQGFLPPELAAQYEPAQRSLLDYWHQLKVELDIMPQSELRDMIWSLIWKYDGSSDSRASEEFANELPPVVRKASERAQKLFRKRNSDGRWERIRAIFSRSKPAKTNER